MLFKSYPHTNHKAIKFVKLRVSMWIIRRKNFFNFSLLPVARLNCYTFRHITLCFLFIPYINLIKNLHKPQPLYLPLLLFYLSLTGLKSLAYQYTDTGIVIRPFCFASPNTKIYCKKAFVASGKWNEF